ncbi:site-specific DNA-methyltransferase [Pseudomonas syringae]|uniref:DNA methyltransferase n=1 Tax=Pseudomonas syringae TaxID=317 RepID=UPI00234D9A47|nr:DNA methyltransferase [Pseudomonas syringae]MDC6536566.1 site-specific DNA-methyltransferase [Pseudomonas syringae]
MSCVGAVTCSQLALFTHVMEAYRDDPDTPVANSRLYEMVAKRAGINEATLNHRMPIGSAGSLRSPTKRAIRWQQQTLKNLGVIEKVPGMRGAWRLTERTRQGLHKARPGVTLLGFSTDLGMALWGTSPDALEGLEQPIELLLTSAPYPLRIPRAYGNPTCAEYVDFICRVLEPIIPCMAESGSLVLNLSNDVFLERSPARSTYLERVTIALEDRLGLSLMDRVIWQNPSKAPGPIQWASKARNQLNVCWEPCLWFARDPLKCKADNRRVLEPHTERHLKLMNQGGENREAVYGDGAYRIRKGSFGNLTAGRIPRNILQAGHACSIGREHRKVLQALELPTHGAGWPLAIPEFFIRFLTEPGDLVVDLFGGRIITGLAAELNERRWLCVEIMLEYLRGGAELFRPFQGFWMNPALARAGREV